MKLYVWVDPYEVNYGSSFAYAVAESEPEARAMILAKAQTEVLTYGQYKTVRPNFRELPEEADRVIDLPCAEIIEWSE